MTEQDVKRGAQGLNLLSLCGGPDREDGMDNFVAELGAVMIVLDLFPSAEHDIADEGRWQAVRCDLENGVYSGGWSAPPCGSFCANRGNDDGPRQVRGVHPPPALAPVHHTSSTHTCKLSSSIWIAAKNP